MNKKELISVAWDSLRLKKNSSKIFYLHIPKCGGTSLRNAITSTYGLPNVLMPNCVNHLDASSSGYAARKMGMHIYDFRTTLLSYYMSIPRARFISGHFPLYKDIDVVRGGWDVVTVFRDPFSKWESNYYYNRYNKTPNHIWRDSDANYVKRIDKEICEFVNLPHAMDFGSDYVMQVLRCEDANDAYREDNIKEAIERFDSLRLIGILEELKVFVKSFQEFYNVKLNVPFANRSPVKSSQKIKLSSQTRAKILELCEPNIRIYEYFKGRIL